MNFWKHFLETGDCEEFKKQFNLKYEKIDEVEWLLIGLKKAIKEISNEDLIELVQKEINAPPEESIIFESFKTMSYQELVELAKLLEKDNLREIQKVLSGKIKISDLKVITIPK